MDNRQSEICEGVMRGIRSVINPILTLDYMIHEDENKTRRTVNKKMSHLLEAGIVKRNGNKHDPALTSSLNISVRSSSQ